MLKMLWGRTPQGEGSTLSFKGISFSILFCCLCVWSDRRRGGFFGVRHTWTWIPSRPPVSCEAWPGQVTEPGSLSFCTCQMGILPSLKGY